jgi:hypothetical protein
VSILVWALTGGFYTNIQNDICELRGRHQSDDDKSYIELLASWPLILVPYMIYRCHRTTETVPIFVLKSLCYYVQQVQLYIYVFTFRMFLTFGLTFWMIFSQNETINEYIKLLYLVELLILTLVISLSKEIWESKFGVIWTKLDKIRDLSSYDKMRAEGENIENQEKDLNLDFEAI